jgi:hypothetical protein
LIKLFGGSGGTQEKMEITLDKLAYKSGETVSGKLVISVDGKKEIKARSFRFVVEGKENTSFTVSEPYRSYDSRDNSTTNHNNVTYSESHEFFSINLEHLLAKSSNPSLITNSGNDIIIQKGSTEIPFEFLLPDNALSSYKGRYASINYDIKATIDKKLRDDTNASTSINVIDIKEEQNKNSSTIYASDKNSKTGLYINLVVAKNIYKTGDTIEGTIYIGKPNSTTKTIIRSIKVKLVATEYASARGRNITTIVQSIDNEILNWKENEEMPFKVKIPETVITKSYHSKLSEFYWEVKANADIPMDKDLNAIARIEIR